MIQTVVLGSHAKQYGSSLEIWSPAGALVQAVAATEPGDDGLYFGDFVDADAGPYRVRHRNAAGDVIWESWVLLTATTGIFPAHDAAMAGPVLLGALETYYPNSIGYKRAVAAIGYGTASAGSTVGSINTSVLSPPGAVLNQFKDKLLTFAADTTTAGLRGVACIISGSSNDALPILTVSELPTSPVAGDTFVIS